MYDWMAIQKHSLCDIDSNIYDCIIYIIPRISEVGQLENTIVNLKPNMRIKAIIMCAAG